MSDERFDKRYFHRFYVGKQRAVAPREYRGRAQLLAGFSAHLGLPIRRILEFGAGMGQFAHALHEAFPRAKYSGTDISAYTCARFGWQMASVVSFDTPRPFDLVVCNDVSQYLSRTDAAGAIGNLARVTSGLLYFSVLTRDDWDERCDRLRTDGAVFLRRAAWYRKQLRQHFRQIGPAVYLSRRDTRMMFALDCAD